MLSRYHVLFISIRSSLEISWILVYTLSEFRTFSSALKNFYLQQYSGVIVACVAHSEFGNTNDTDTHLIFVGSVAPPETILYVYPCAI